MPRHNGLCAHRSSASGDPRNRHPLTAGAMNQAEIQELMHELPCPEMAATPAPQPLRIDSPRALNSAAAAGTSD